MYTTNFFIFPTDIISRMTKSFVRIVFHGHLIYKYFAHIIFRGYKSLFIIGLSLLNQNLYMLCYFDLLFREKKTWKNKDIIAVYFFHPFSFLLILSDFLRWLILADDSFRATLRGLNFADVKLSNISRGLCFVIKVKIKKTREI